ncbi:MAG: hypothetical protein RBT68_00340 [Spirochaetia bacterium]|nr:hypothetical protein [Spirochaetia bacterium]
MNQNIPIAVATTSRSSKDPRPAKGLILVLVSISTVVAVSILIPGKREAIVSGSVDFLKEVALILPAICIMMGLFGVFVSENLVMRTLGRSSGWKGMLIAMGIGSLPTGPLYAAFPIAAALREKGARVSNIFLLMTAWACIKLPQELLELRFLGSQFMLARLALTIGLAIPAALLIEWFVDAEPTSIR